MIHVHTPTPSGARALNEPAFSRAGGAQRVVALCEERLQNRSRNWRSFAMTYFRDQRSALMNLLDVLELDAMPAGKPMLDAACVMLNSRFDRFDGLDDGELNLSILHRDWLNLVRHPSEPNWWHRR